MQKGSQLKKVSKRNSVVKGRKVAIVKDIAGIKDDLTKKFLETAARKSMEEAAEETMKVMGYNVIAKNGWIVKVFPNNRVERISPIPRIIEKR